jgi:hypothetical protein
MQHAKYPLPFLFFKILFSLVRFRTRDAVICGSALDCVQSTKNNRTAPNRRKQPLAREKARIKGQWKRALTNPCEAITDNRLLYNLLSLIGLIVIPCRDFLVPSRPGQDLCDGAAHDVPAAANHTRGRRYDFRI